MKKFKEPWQFLKLIIKGFRQDEWLIDVENNRIRFFIKGHNAEQWLLFADGCAIVEIPNQCFSVELEVLVNPRGDPYHLIHDRQGAGERFNPDELQLLRALYELCVDND